MRWTVVFRIAGRALGAVPVAQVIETMRPLPVIPVAGLPSFVLGASIIRGLPTPVVDLAQLVGEHGTPRRYLSVRVADRAVALAVHDVVGVRALSDEAPGEVAPLLSKAVAGAAAELLALDGELVAVLDSARFIDDASWRRIDEVTA